MAETGTSSTQGTAIAAYNLSPIKFKLKVIKQAIPTISISKKNKTQKVRLDGR